MEVEGTKPQDSSDVGMPTRNDMNNNTSNNNLNNEQGHFAYLDYQVSAPEHIHDISSLAYNFKYSRIQCSISHHILQACMYVRNSQKENHNENDNIVKPVITIRILINIMIRILVIMIIRIIPVLTP